MIGITALRRARSGGLRAGMNNRPRFNVQANGLKTLAAPRNPYTGRYRLLAAVWEYYYQEALYNRLRKEMSHATR